MDADYRVALLALRVIVDHERGLKGTIMHDPVVWTVAYQALNKCGYLDKPIPAAPDYVAMGLAQPPGVTLTSQERHALITGAQESSDPTCCKLLLELHDRTSPTKPAEPDPEKSCLSGGAKHCPYFKKGHPCCDCGATAGEESAR